MSTLSEISDFVRERTGYRGELAANASLQDDVRIYGADVQEFMQEYAKRFRVDISAYRWYFHTGDEAGFNPGGLFFRPPQARVPETPITMDVLRISAEAGRWVVHYPAHSLPKYRHDFIVNRVIVYGNALIVMYVVARQLLG